MKFFKLTAAVLIFSVAVACNSAKNNNATADENAEILQESIDNGTDIDPEALLPSKQQADSVAYLVGINFGSFIKGYDFGDLNYALIKKGMMDFINAKGDQQDSNFVKQFKIDPNKMNDLFNDYLQKRRLYRAAVNIEKIEEGLESVEFEPVELPELELESTGGEAEERQEIIETLEKEVKKDDPFKPFEALKLEDLFGEDYVPLRDRDPKEATRFTQSLNLDWTKQ